MAKLTKKELQERFFGIERQKQIIELNQDISDVFFLFEELRQKVDIQKLPIEHIKNSQEKIKTDILTSTTELNETSDISDKLRHFYYAFVGGGMASVFLLYNPYIGAGAISTGLIAGTLFSYFKK
jgi:hypothetical protein